MSVFANDSGGAEHRVTLLKRGSGVLQNAMLKNPLIKKAENYHLQCDRFVTNSLPRISQWGGDMIAIYPRFNYNQPDTGFDLQDAGQNILFRKSKFAIAGQNPKQGERIIYSTAGLIDQICEFFSDFNFTAFIHGANFSQFAEQDPFDGLPINQEFLIPEHALHDFRHDIINDIDPVDVVKYVSAGVDSLGRLQLNLSSQFLTNFYIVLDDVFASQIGFPNKIFARNQTVQGVTYTQISTDVTIDDLLVQYLPHPVFVFNLQPHVSAGVNIKSTQSIFRIDDRLSYDLEISLPIAQTIDTMNGKESHTFLLSRFQINDYQNIHTRTKQKDGLLLTEALIEDQLQGGMVDLVRGAPSSHVSQLLNGSIQALDLRIILRYKEYYFDNDNVRFNIARQQVDMGDYGFYDLLLQFNKRVG